MPVSLWVAILVLAALLVVIHFHDGKFMSVRTTSIVIFGICLTLIVVLRGLPYIVETNPRFVDSWLHGRTAKGILETGTLQPDQFNYQAFPSSFILLSALSLVSGIPITVLLWFIPVIFVVLFFSFLYLFSYNLFGKSKLASMVVLIYGLSTFGLGFHFSPETVGWLFFLLLLAYLLRNLNRSGGGPIGSRRDLLVVVILLAGIATTHAVTQLTTVLVVAMLMLFAKRIWIAKAAFQNMFFILILAVTLFSAWATIFALTYSTSIISQFVGAFKTVLSDFMSSVAAQPLQTRNPSEVSALLTYRQALYGVVLICSFIGGYLLWRREKRKLVYFLAVLIASILAAPLTLFGILPLERTIKLAFIPISVLGAYLVVKKKRLGGLVLIALLLTFPVNFASLYWDEIGRSTYFDWDIDSAKFIARDFNGVVLGQWRDTAVMDFYGNFDRVYNDYFLLGKRPDLFEMYNYSFIEAKGIGLVYITQLTTESAGERSGQTLTLGNFLDNPFLDCVYSNDYSAVLVRAQS